MGELVDHALGTLGDERGKERLEEHPGCPHGGHPVRRHQHCCRGLQRSSSLSVSAFTSLKRQMSKDLVADDREQLQIEGIREKRIRRTAQGRTNAPSVPSKGSERRGEIRQKGPYLIWVLVLILLVRLDLRGLPVIGLLDLRLPSEGKPTSSVAVDEGENRAKGLRPRCQMTDTAG